MDNEKLETLLQAVVGIIPYVILLIIAPMLILFKMDPSSHDVVLSIVSGLLGVIAGPHAASAATTAIKAAMSLVKNANPPAS